MDERRISENLKKLTLQDLALRTGLTKGKIIRETDQFAGYDYEVFGQEKPGKNMEPFIIHSPWQITRMYTHEGEEFIHVMDGSLEFIYGDETYILNTGDNIYFDSCIPHSGKSLGDKKASSSFIWYQLQHQRSESNNPQSGPTKRFNYSKILKRFIYLLYLSSGH